MPRVPVNSNWVEDDDELMMIGSKIRENKGRIDEGFYLGDWESESTIDKQNPSAKAPMSRGQCVWPPDIEYSWWNSEKTLCMLRFDGAWGKSNDFEVSSLE